MHKGIYLTEKKGKQMKKSKFNWKEFLTAIAAISIPVALQNLLSTTGSMVDTMMLATLGETTVGSVGLCAQFSSLFFSGYWGFVGGGTLFVSQYWGAKDHGGIRRAYGITMCLVLAVGVIFGLMATVFPEFIMGIYTDKAEIQQIGIRYLRIVGFSYPLVSITVVMSMLFRSIERVRIPLYASIASVFANCFCNYVLIFGKLGMPALGAEGAALGTVIASAVNLAVLVIYALVRKVPYALEFHRCFRWNRPFIKLYLQRCFPILCNEGAMGVSTMLINIVLGRQSAAAIAAIAICRTIEGLVIAFFGGFASAAAILVGKGVGAGEHEKAYEQAKRIVYMTSGIIFVVCIAILGFHTPLFTALGLSGESFEICTVLCTIYCVVAIIRMGNWQHNDCFRAGGDPTFGTVMEIAFMYLLVIPCVYIAQFVFHAPFYVVFLFVYCDEPIRYFIMERHLYSRKWIRPVSDKGLAAIGAFREKYGVKMGYPLVDAVMAKLQRR